MKKVSFHEAAGPSERPTTGYHKYTYKNENGLVFQK